MFVRFLLLAFLGLQSLSSVQSRSQTDGFQIFCKDVQIDLILVIDSSGSVNITEELDWFSNLVHIFDIGQSENLIGAVMFSRSAEILFNLSTYTDIDAISSAIQDTPYRGKDSYLDRAFNLIYYNDLFSTDYGGREEARDVVIAVTSDITTRPRRTYYAAERLIEKDIFLRIVPFGDDPGALTISEAVNIRAGEDSTFDRPMDLCFGLDGAFYFYSDNDEVYNDYFD